mmetsp:Transcript_10285/g.38948  ORF Transcript_10285/g.38948 Transcript_10285/m.38948 type:complete len:257 (-) Transcript_10285:78-848(-)
MGRPVRGSGSVALRPIARAVPEEPHGEPGPRRRSHGLRLLVRHGLPHHALGVHRQGPPSRIPVHEGVGTIHAGRGRILCKDVLHVQALSCRGHRRRHGDSPLASPRPVPAFGGAHLRHAVQLAARFAFGLVLLHRRPHGLCWRFAPRSHLGCAVRGSAVVVRFCHRRRRGSAAFGPSLRRHVGLRPRALEPGRHPGPRRGLYGCCGAPRRRRGAVEVSARRSEPGAEAKRERLRFKRSVRAANPARRRTVSSPREH